MAPFKRQSKADFDRGQTQRRKILSLCHELGWTYPTHGGRVTVNFVALDGWMNKYSYLHKPLNYYTPAELPKLVTQFENMAAKELSGRDAQEVINERIERTLNDASDSLKK